MFSVLILRETDCLQIFSLILQTDFSIACFLCCAEAFDVIPFIYFCFVVYICEAVFKRLLLRPALRKVFLAFALEVLLT
jgi:hypothetical protein